MLGPGMTALTGETGAGKTLLVEAIELLVGGRADAVMVRHGADRGGGRGPLRRRRRRGRAAPGRARRGPVAGLRRRSAGHGVGRWPSWGARWSTSTASTTTSRCSAPAVQRAALDRFGGIDLEPLRGRARSWPAIDAQLGELGGDERARAREIDLLRFQVDELEAAGLRRSRRGRAARGARRTLADALGPPARRPRAAHEHLDGDEGAADAVGRVPLAALDGRAPFAERRGAAARRSRPSWPTWPRSCGRWASDRGRPGRLAEVQERRQLLHELRRKYGETSPT